MTEPDRDPVVRHAIEELRRLPDADAAAKRRIVDAAAAARLTPADDAVVAHVAPRRPRWALRIGMLAAAAVIGFFARDAWRPNTLAQTTAAYDKPAAVPVRPAASGERELLPVAQPFVFTSKTAHKVAVVGDFNKWNGATSPMTRSPDGSMWSATLSILPGRHAYGFIVDDTLFVLDPSAPRARDTDLGTAISVLMVGRP